jgi:hypothetical protein
VRALIEPLEVAGTQGTVEVAPQEYIRLLGYPRGHVLEGRARELADWARRWYAEHGRPWFYARQAESLSIEGTSVVIDGVAFNSPRLRNTLREAEAESVVLVGVGAGKEAEEESRRLWEEEKPDEYFFLEVFGSAVVEHLTMTTGARLCAWADEQGMAVLPHYSPGYPEWDVAEQPRLLEAIQRTRRAEFPSPVEVLESGMPRPKKTLLAVFGLTRHTERLRPLTSLIPCESCPFGPCQFRRAPYRRAPRAFGEQVSGGQAVLDANGRYSVQRRALARWAAERLSLRAGNDGSLDAVFRYEGTTCTNMGRPLAFDYHVKLGPREEGYPIREQRCEPAAGDTGHMHMCQYIADGDRLMSAIEEEKPLHGQRLNAVLDWHPPMNAAGCFCELPSRARKWALVLETIHFALVQQESVKDMDIA